MSKMNELLSGFLSGTLTSKEKSELYRLMKDEGRKNDVMAWLQEQWENEHVPAESEIPSAEMLAKIKTEIEVNNQKWKSFLRYAAVVIIAFGLSWAVQWIMTKPDHAVSVAETSQQYNNIVVPHGSKTKVILPDSTTVWLNAGARLTYPVNFSHHQREVYLQGEGFFDVKSDRKKPFVVHSNGLNIKVLGTKFNVMAYTEEPFVEATLIEGAIEVQALKDNVDLRLKPGQKLTLRKENEKYEVQNIETVELSIAWMENKLVFTKERFGEVKTKLERWYGVTIEVKDAEILTYLLTGTFENQTFEQAMNALSQAASFKFKIVNNHVIVSK